MPMRDRWLRKERPCGHCGEEIYVRGKPPRVVKHPKQNISPRERMPMTINAGEAWVDGGIHQ